MPELMIFGSTGTLGKATLEKFEAQGWNITCGVRKVVNPRDVQLPFDCQTVPAGLEGKSFDAVVFAQGANLNGSVMENPREQLEELFEANVTMIAETIAAMMKHDLIAQGGRVVIIDFRLDSPVGPPKSARLAPERVTAELASAGYALQGEHAFLPNQYFLVFGQAAR